MCCTSFLACLPLERKQVCGGPALSLFRHEELELLICGLPHFDFDVNIHLHPISLAGGNLVF